MKKWYSMILLTPALVMALAANVGFYRTQPVSGEVLLSNASADHSVYELQLEEAESGEASTEAAPETESTAIETLGSFEDGVYTGSGTGFSGETAVEVTVENGQITAVQVLSHEDEDSFFQRAEAVMSEVLHNQTWEVDCVSGATFSSHGILDAVKNALTGEQPPSHQAEVSDQAPVSEENADLEEYSDTNGSWEDGTFVGTAEGFGGTIKVSVSVEGGKIVSIDVTNHSGETGEFYNKAKKIIDNILNAQSLDVDTISGATYSSAGIKNAVSNALNGISVSDDSGESYDSDDSDAEHHPKQHRKRHRKGQGHK